MEYELFEDKDRPHKKKKLHELLDKYGTIDELEQHGSVEDNLEYMFSGNKELLDEVLAERKMGMLKQPLKQVQGDVVQHDAISDVQHDGGSATSNENIVNDEENDVDDMKNHTPKTRQRETLTQYARESLPATSRSSLDDEDMAKNAALHPMFKTPNEEDDEWILRAFAHNTRARQYAENEYSGTKSDEGDNTARPYIFSKKMRSLLGFKESKNKYNEENSKGGGIGALGLYQIRREGLIDTGYLDENNQWTGKNGINSKKDFLNNSSLQEQIFDEYMNVQYKYLSHFGITKYTGCKFKGVKNNFTVTNTGLLAATHRVGIGYMNKFFKNIEKDKNGLYYINYSNITNPDLKQKFMWIETRLREFEE